MLRCRTGTYIWIYCFYIYLYTYILLCLVSSQCWEYVSPYCDGMRAWRGWLTESGIHGSRPSMRIVEQLEQIKYAECMAEPHHIWLYISLLSTNPFIVSKRLQQPFFKLHDTPHIISSWVSRIRLDAPLSMACATQYEERAAENSSQNIRTRPRRSIYFLTTPFFDSFRSHIPIHRIDIHRFLPYIYPALPSTDPCKLNQPTVQNNPESEPSREVCWGRIAHFDWINQGICSWQDRPVELFMKVKQEHGIPVEHEEYAELLNLLRHYRYNRINS